VKVKDKGSVTAEGVHIVFVGVFLLPDSFQTDPRTILPSHPVFKDKDLTIKVNGNLRSMTRPSRTRSRTMTNVTAAGVHTVFGGMFLLPDSFQTDGVVFAFAAYYRNSNPVRFQLWRPLETTGPVTTVRLLAHLTVTPSVIESRETVCTPTELLFNPFYTRTPQICPNSMANPQAHKIKQ